MTSPQAADVTWRASTRLRWLAGTALLFLVAALVSGRADLMLLAAPALGALALLPRRGLSRSAEPVLRVAAELSQDRCFEDEDVELTVRVDADMVLDEITCTVRPDDTVSLADERCSSQGALCSRTTLRAGRTAATWTLRPGKWGHRVPATVQVSCRWGMGCWETTVSVAPPSLEIFPYAPRMRARMVPPELLRRIGEHTGRAVGDGVEFAGLRPYVAGDPLRDVNRPVSISRGQWYVNQRAAPRAADLVIVLDVFTDVVPPVSRSQPAARVASPGTRSAAAAAGTVDLAVRGAAALADAYLRISDRVGAVVLGGMLRWLAPGPGDRQFYRLAELAIEAKHFSYVDPDLTRVPRAALPPGSLVVMFSPLLDPRALNAVTDLRRRGFSLIVVDTLRTEPPVTRRSSRPDQLALRVWRLERTAARSRLADIGVPVLAWTEDGELDALLSAPAGVSVPAAHGRAS